MNIKPMIAALGVSYALLAAPAFAQSSATKAEGYAKDKAVKEMQDKAKDMSTDVKSDAKTDHNLEITTSDSIVTVGDEGTVVMDKSVIIAPVTNNTAMDDSKMVKDMGDAVTATPVITEVACPAGTTAQDNGTCMITGDYQE